MTAVPRTESVSVQITCPDCPDRKHPWLPLTIRYGCEECGEDFRDRHLADTGHTVEMSVRRSSDWRAERVEQQPWPRWR